ncbi:MAG: excinuclease ABC subunit UvrA [Verrucomicrobiales bacterium]|nr:excinuclease ABC subunit UvrA [Verrucomicrobiales bacterium]
MPKRSKLKKKTPKNAKQSWQGGIISLREVRQNNLKGFDLDLPLGQLIVVTGPSGSGKSSLAFQTLYAEGQRRYIETFSPYTRQFFERMDKPRVEEVNGIPPSIAIEQGNTVRTTRSTVGTLTGINDYLKVLFPHIAVPYCPKCGEEIFEDNAESVTQFANVNLAGKSVLVGFGVPVPSQMKPPEFFQLLSAQGYLRIWVWGKLYRTDEPEKYHKKTLPEIVNVVQDRIKISKGAKNIARLNEAIETAFLFGKGTIRLIDSEFANDWSFSSGKQCAPCGITIRDPSPGLFSFNSPLGACPKCRGFGRTLGIDLDRALPDKSLSISEGVVKAFQGQRGSECQTDLLKCAKVRGVDVDLGYEKLSKKNREWVLYGERGDPESNWQQGLWYGVKGFFDWIERKSYKMHVRIFLSRYRSYTTCFACRGTRLQPDALNYKIGNHTLPDIWQVPISDLLNLWNEKKSKLVEFSNLDPTALLLWGEVGSRLRYLQRVGLGYLTLDRSARSLSGGEMQRVHLTTCLGASLVNTLFVLDEPSIGLHPKDTDQLINVMNDLRDAGNTVLVVEHEESIIRAADYLVDIGPGRGEDGGDLVYEGPISDYEKSRKKISSLTLDYLSGDKSIPIPSTRRKPNKRNVLKVRGAQQNNLKNIDLEIPLGLFVCVTGVSGSGKSTLVHDVIYLNLIRERGESTEELPGEVHSIVGHSKLRQVVLVDQSPLSRNPRSTPVVYVGAFEHIRKLFSETPEAKSSGHLPGYFSFNSGAGRCGRCWGNGFEKVEMQFLSDLYVKCPECEGKRYGPEVLEFQLMGKSIHDVLDLTIESAIHFFETIENKKAARVVADLKPLADVGLGYLKLGQPINTLSGGESQRLKLVGHLLKNKPKKKDKSTAKDLLLFDEPTTGLHFDDIRILLNVFQRLVDDGHSVLVIEHNCEVIKCADHVIDLGPKGGSEGGEIIAIGTPEEIKKEKKSYTGKFLWRDHKPKDLLRPIESKEPAKNIISVRGARENNLKNLKIDIPHDAFTVITGLSGSGKSTLAFDVLFAEGQRRFLDSMSAYVRQFVQQMERPDVDQVHGLPPTVAIEQRVSRGGGKSTVSTITEIYHFLRLLFAKVGTQYCPDCGVSVDKKSKNSIISSVKKVLKLGPVKLLSPLVRGRKGFHTDTAAWALRQGIRTLLVDGKFMESEGFQKLERFKEHMIDGLIAELHEKSKHSEITQFIDDALRWGHGTARILREDGQSIVLSSEMSCPDCGNAYDELDPRLFSYNSPHGWCHACRGYGYIVPSLSDSEKHDSITAAELEEERRHATSKEKIKDICPVCDGSRINKVARSVWVDHITIDTLTRVSVTNAIEIIDGFSFEGTKKLIARDILAEIKQRLLFLQRVGLGYLGLDRSATTLSGGESQRIRLAAQLGSNLRGVLYVLDEPTIGLHPRDNDQLLKTLISLRDQGNSLVVVEHDEKTIKCADHLVDLGPGAGKEGGEVVFQGKINSKNKKSEKNRAAASITLNAISEQIEHPISGNRRKLPAPSSKEGWIRIKNANANNLKNIDCSIPLSRLSVLTGVSGSGKSSLMRGVLKPAVDSKIKSKKTKELIHKTWKSITGTDQIVAAYEVDQSPIGKTSRSTPATYVKIFDEIRKLYSNVHESRLRGYAPGRFSFNTEGGRCESCRGNGRIKLEMNFLPTTWVECGECKGDRYNRATLEIFFNGKNIAQVMKMSVSEACTFFDVHPKIHTTLALLHDTGLGYLSLGQPSTTLSGGEAQRIKLVAEIRKGQGRARNAKMKGVTGSCSNLYLIEEPTIGLHHNDVVNLIRVLHALVDEGHTVIVIEHNTSIMAEADYIIDIGPEAGEGGGQIVTKGRPEQVIRSKTSRTSPFLREILNN